MISTVFLGILLLFLASASHSEFAIGGAATLRAPAIPLINLDPFFQTFLFSDDPTKSNVKSWYGSTREMFGYLRIDNATYRFLGKDSTSKALPPPEIDISPTRTTLTFKAPSVQLKLSFLTTTFVDDLRRMSRPVAYIIPEITTKLTANVQLYFDITAEHALNSPFETVEYSSWALSNIVGVKIGNTKQNVLSYHCDSCNVNWGYLHLAVQSSSSVASSVDRLAEEQLESLREPSTRIQGSSNVLRDRRRFLQKPSSSGLLRKPGISMEHDFGRVSSGTVVSKTIYLGYDDVASVNYYGTDFKAYWTQKYTDIQHAILDAASEESQMVKKSLETDTKLSNDLSEKYGVKYALLGRLVYRHVIGALKLAWNHQKNTTWAFLKEISTNGDMNTVDVIFPMSPFLLYMNPELLKTMLVPVLEFANNATNKVYLKPYSPHQIGVYPQANAGTFAQEPMPMENTGNMFIMMLALAQRQQGYDWFYPKYYSMLKLWADYLMSTLPFPEVQLCTDDFQGRLRNNTNLSAKGIVALEAFAQICRLVGEDGCADYSKQAKEFANTWMDTAVVIGDGHSKLSFHGKDSTFSLKYNLVHQKLLKLNGPFPTSLFEREVAFYKSKMNRYGVPLDNRNTYSKVDWLSWVALLDGQKETFEELFLNPVFDMVNETKQRVPFIDLYDTKNAKMPIPLVPVFRDRPVLGAIYAAMLVE